MSSTAVASIILGIVTVVLSVLLGKKSGQKEAIEQKLEGAQEALKASQKETQLAKENAVQAQETASQAKSQLSKANVLAKQTAIETGALDRTKDRVIEYLKTGAQRDSEMQDLSNQLQNARERNDLDKGFEIMRKLAELAIEKGMGEKPSNDEE